MGKSPSNNRLNLRRHAWGRWAAKVCELCRLEQPPPRGRWGLDKNRWNKSTSHTPPSLSCRYGGGRDMAPVALIPVPRSAETAARLSRASFIHEWILWARFQVESTRPRCCLRVSATWLPDRKQLDVSKCFQGLFAWRVRRADELVFSTSASVLCPGRARVWVSAPRRAVGTRTDVWGVSGVLREVGGETAAPSSRPDSGLTWSPLAGQGRSENQCPIDESFCSWSLEATGPSQPVHRQSGWAADVKSGHHVRFTHDFCTFRESIKPIILS